MDTEKKSWAQVFRRDDPANESLGEHVMTLVIGVPLGLLLYVGVPLAVGIGIPWTILADHTSVPDVAAAAISIPSGIAFVAFVYFAVGKGWVEFGDD